MIDCVLFFFSSRRRHTRFDCDWSSDVCSSDLARPDRLRCRATAHPWRIAESLCAACRLGSASRRSEEHTSELQSQSNLVCRLLLEKKKKKSKTYTSTDDRPAGQLHHRTSR